MDIPSRERAMVTRDDASVLAALREISVASKRDARAGRRWIHPFPAKMPVAVPQIAIRHRLDKDGVLLDPFSGSGTTLHAAQVEGRKSVGVDMDPLSLLVAKVVTTPYRSEQLKDLGHALIKKATRIAKGRANKGVPRHMPEEDESFVRFWFPEER